MLDSFVHPANVFEPRFTSVLGSVTLLIFGVRAKSLSESPSVPSLIVAVVADVEHSTARCPAYLIVLPD